MFSVIVAGEEGEGLRKVESALRIARLRVQSLRERRATPPLPGSSDGLVVVTETSDRTAATGAVLEARRDDELRRVPFCIVARWLGARAGHAFGASAVIRLDAPPAAIADEVRRMILGARDARVHAHQLAGDLGTVGVDELLDVLANGRRDAVLHLASGGVDGTIALREGLVVEARFGGAEGREATEIMRRLRQGSFRLDLRPDTARPPARSSPPPPAPIPRSSTAAPPAAEASASSFSLSAPPRRAQLDGADGADHDGQLAVVGAAVMNALAAYARLYLADARVASALEDARRDASALAPTLSGFQVTPHGDVVVARIADAAGGGARAVGAWMAIALRRLERMRPGRFTPSRFDAIVGGLSLLLEKVHWRHTIASAVQGGTEP